MNSEGGFILSEKQTVKQDPWNNKERTMNLGGGEGSMYIRAKLVKNVIINIVDATKGDWIFEFIKSLFTLCFSSLWEIPKSSKIGLAFWTNDWKNYYQGGISSF